MNSKIDLRIDEKTKQALTDRAKERNIKVSELVRQILIDYCSCPTNEAKLSDNVPQDNNLSDKPINNRTQYKRPTKPQNDVKKPQKGRINLSDYGI